MRRKGSTIRRLKPGADSRAAIARVGGARKSLRAVSFSAQRDVPIAREGPALSPRAQCLYGPAADLIFVRNVPKEKGTGSPMPVPSGSVQQLPFGNDGWRGFALSDVLRAPSDA
jgi:hypothetical protein